MTIFQRSHAAQVATGTLFYFFLWWVVPLGIGGLFIWTGSKPKLLSQEFWVCLGLIVVGLVCFLLIPIGIIAFIYQWTPVWEIAAALYFGGGFTPACSYLLGEIASQPSTAR